MRRIQFVGLLAVIATFTGIAIAGSATPTAVNSTPPYFSGGFEHGLSGFNLSGVGEVVPTVIDRNAASGRNSCRFVLTGTEDRSELVVGGDGRGGTDGTIEFHDGDEYWYGLSFNILRMVYGEPGAHNLFMQFKSEGTGSPFFALQLWDTGGERGLWSAGTGMGGDRYLAPVRHRRWHHVEVHFRASSQRAGYYRIYLDGQLVDSRRRASMIVPGKDEAYIKNGLYRNGREIPGKSVILIDDVKLGPSRASVLPG